MSNNQDKAINVARIIGWYFVGQTPEWKMLTEENERLRKDNLTPTEEEKGTLYALVGKAFRDAHTTIRNMGITAIEYKDIDDNTAKVHVKLSRPGLIIGPKGVLLDEIEKVLSKIFHKAVTIGLEEEKVVDFLYVNIPEEDPIDWGRENW